MRALCRGPAGVSLVDLASVRPGPGEVRLSITVAGLCRTDLAVARGERGRSGVVLGHEAAGVVTALGPGVDSSLQGRQVAIWPFLPAGQLGVDVDGLFRDEVCLPAGAVHVVDDALDPRVAASFEPVAAALAVDDALSGVPRDEPVVVVGRNRIAELLARVLESRGRRAVRRAGSASEVDGERHVVETRPDGKDFAEILERLARGGTLYLKSRGWDRVALPLHRVVEREILLRGAYYSRPGAALATISPGLFDGLFGGTWPIESWSEAFAAAAGDTKKVFLSLRGEP